EVLADRGDECAALLGQWRDAAAVEVAPGDGGQPLRRYAAAPCDVLQEGHDVVRPFGTPEGQDEQRVVRGDVHAHAGHRPTPVTVDPEKAYLSLVAPDTPS